MLNCDCHLQSSFEISIILLLTEFVSFKMTHNKSTELGVTALETKIQNVRSWQLKSVCFFAKSMRFMWKMLKNLRLRQHRHESDSTRETRVGLVLIRLHQST